MSSAGRIRVCVYIDGLNLYHSALRNSPSRWLDVRAFARRLAAPDELASVLYATGRLNPDNASDPLSPTRQREYLKALTALGVPTAEHNFVVPTAPRVVSRGQSWRARTDRPLPEHLAEALDRLDARSPYERRVRVRLPEEKMTDVALAVAMVNDYHLGRCDRSILVANDSDYVPALECLSGLGHEVHVVAPGRTVSKQLGDKNHGRWTASVLLPDRLRESELPDVFSVGASVFRRPRAWSETTEAPLSEEGAPDPDDRSAG